MRDELVAIVSGFYERDGNLGRTVGYMAAEGVGVREPIVIGAGEKWHSISERPSFEQVRQMHDDLQGIVVWIGYDEQQVRRKGGYRGTIEDLARIKELQDRRLEMGYVFLFVPRKSLEQDANEYQQGDRVTVVEFAEAVIHQAKGYNIKGANDNISYELIEGIKELNKRLAEGKVNFFECLQPVISEQRPRRDSILYFGHRGRM